MSDKSKKPAHKPKPASGKSTSRSTSRPSSEPETMLDETERELNDLNERYGKLIKDKKKYTKENFNKIIIEYNNLALKTNSIDVYKQLASIYKDNKKFGSRVKAIVNYKKILENENFNEKERSEIEGIINDLKKNLLPEEQYEYYIECIADANAKDKNGTSKEEDILKLYRESIKFLELAAKGNNKEAGLKLAEYYENGFEYKRTEIVKKDPIEAIIWYNLSRDTKKVEELTNELSVEELEELINRYDRIGKKVYANEIVKWYELAIDKSVETGGNKEELEGELNTFIESHKSDINFPYLGYYFFKSKDDGKERAKRKEKAKKYYKKNIDILGEDGVSFNTLINYADLLEDGSEEQIKYYKKAVDKGSTVALTRLGYVYIDKEEYELAEECFRKATESYKENLDKNTAAEFVNYYKNSLKIREKTIIEKNLIEEIKCLEVLKAESKSRANKSKKRLIEIEEEISFDQAKELAIFYSTDEKYKNPKLALKYYEIAISKNLGKDDKEIKKIYKDIKTKERNISSLYYELSKDYEDCFKVSDKDYCNKVALNLYEKGGEKGSPECTYRLGEIYENSEMGITNREEEAKGYYEKGYELNNADSSYKLGKIYFSEYNKNGEKEENLKQAYIYCLIASLNKEFVDKENKVKNSTLLKEIELVIVQKKIDLEELRKKAEEEARKIRMDNMEKDVNDLKTRVETLESEEQAQNDKIKVLENFKEKIEKNALTKDDIENLKKIFAGKEYEEIINNFLDGKIELTDGLKKKIAGVLNAEIKTIKVEINELKIIVTKFQKDLTDSLNKQKEQLTKQQQQLDEQKKAINTIGNEINKLQNKVNECATKEDLNGVKTDVENALKTAKTENDNKIKELKTQLEQAITNNNTKLKDQISAEMAAREALSEKLNELSAKEIKNAKDIEDLQSKLTAEQETIKVDIANLKKKQDEISGELKNKTDELAEAQQGLTDSLNKQKEQLEQQRQQLDEQQNTINTIGNEIEELQNKVNKCATKTDVAKALADAQTENNNKINELKTQLEQVIADNNNTELKGQISAEMVARAALSEKLNELSAKEIKNAKDIEDLQSKLTAEQETIKVDIANLKKKQDEISGELKNKTDELAEAQQGLKNSLNEQKKQLDEQQQQLGKQQTAIGQINNEIKELKTKVNECASKTDVVKALADAQTENDRKINKLEEDLKQAFNGGNKDLEDRINKEKEQREELAKKLDDLATKDIETIKEDLQTEISNMNSEIDSLKKEQTNLGNRIEEVNNNLVTVQQELKNSLNEQKKQLDEQQQQLGKQQTAIGQINNEIKELKTKVNECASKTDVVKALADAQTENDRKINELEKNLKQAFNEGNKDLENRINEEKKQREELAKKLNDLATKDIETINKDLQTEISNRNSAIDNLKEEQTNLGNRIDNVNNNLATVQQELKNSLNEQKKQLEQQRQQLEKQEEDIVEIKKKINNLQTQIESCASQDQVNSTIEKFKESIEETMQNYDIDLQIKFKRLFSLLNESRDLIVAEINQFSNEINNHLYFLEAENMVLNNQITEIGRNIEILDSKIKDIDKKLESHETKITDLEKKDNERDERLNLLFSKIEDIENKNKKLEDEVSRLREENEKLKNRVEKTEIDTKRLDDEKADKAELNKISNKFKFTNVKEINDKGNLYKNDKEDEQNKDNEEDEQDKDKDKKNIIPTQDRDITLPDSKQPDSPVQPKQDPIQPGHDSKKILFGIKEHEQNSESKNYHQTTKRKFGTLGGNTKNVPKMNNKEMIQHLSNLYYLIGTSNQYNNENEVKTGLAVANMLNSTKGNVHGIVPTLDYLSDNFVKQIKGSKTPDEALKNIIDDAELNTVIDSKNIDKCKEELSTIISKYQEGVGNADRDLKKKAIFEENLKNELYGYLDRVFINKANDVYVNNNPDKNNEFLENFYKNIDNGSSYLQQTTIENDVSIPDLSKVTFINGDQKINEQKLKDLQNGINGQIKNDNIEKDFKVKGFSGDKEELESAKKAVIHTERTKNQFNGVQRDESGKVTKVDGIKEGVNNNQATIGLKYPEDYSKEYLDIIEKSNNNIDVEFEQKTKQLSELTQDQQNNILKVYGLNGNENIEVLKFNGVEVLIPSNMLDFVELNNGIGRNRGLLPAILEQMQKASVLNGGNSEAIGSLISAEIDGKNITIEEAAKDDEMVKKMSKLLLHNLGAVDINDGVTPLDTFIDSDIKGIIKQCLGGPFATKIESAKSRVKQI